MFAPNSIFDADYELHSDLKDTYTYPAHGWSWFVSEAAAREFFKLPEVESQ